MQSYCIYKSLGLSFKSARRLNRMAQRIARMDNCINEIQTIHECADRIIVIKEASRLRSLGCTGNSDNTGDEHGRSNEVMDASTGISDNTTDGQHGGRNGVMAAPLLRSLGCTGNSDSTGDGGHEVMKSWMLALEIVTTQLMGNTVEVMESWMHRY